MQSHCRGQAFDSPQLHQPKWLTTKNFFEPVGHVPAARAALSRDRLVVEVTLAVEEYVERRIDLHEEIEMPIARHYRHARSRRNDGRCCIVDEFHAVECRLDRVAASCKRPRDGSSKLTGARPFIRVSHEYLVGVNLS